MSSDIHVHTVSATCTCIVCVLTVTLSIDGALIERHDVLSERSSLVTEDVFNLGSF